MKLDPLKLVKARQQLGYSQQAVADKSNVHIRTVQRAEGGISISGENAAFIAAALQTSLRNLLANDNAEGSNEHIAGKTITLRRASSGRSLLDLLYQTGMCKIDCEVEPTKENISLLKTAAILLESQMPEPTNEDKFSWPPSHPLAERLDIIAKINDVISSLGEVGIGVFAGESWLDVHVPEYDPYERGFYYPEGQQASGMRAARIILSEHPSDKLVKSAQIDWPLRLVVDLDEDVPF